MNMIKMKLASCGNIDHYQNPNDTVYGAKDHFFLCPDIAAAQQACRSFIERHDLGGGNWIGGDVYEFKGGYIGYISYNGRFWVSEEKVLLDESCKNEWERAMTHGK